MILVSLYLANKVEEFLDTNDTIDTSNSSLWETYKVVIRDHVIFYKASWKKTRNARLLEINSKLLQLETQYQQNDDNQTLQEIMYLRYEYNTILTKQVCEQLSRLRSRYFEIGDEPHALLARQLRGQHNSKAIHWIRSANWDLLTHLKLGKDDYWSFIKNYIVQKQKVMWIYS